jgi:hypothetical protein
MTDSNNNNHHNHNVSTPVVQVVLPLEDFAEDLDLRLGRANGNIFHRRPGVEGLHDGQVMVRLKKKRFIVIDYSIVPNEADLQHAAMSPHIHCPLGAGKTICTTPECNKIGVPVLLYDSEPHETPSLYLRSGLCFTCQRNLNEKRRTQRKKPAEKEAAAAEKAKKQDASKASASAAAMASAHAAAYGSSAAANTTATATTTTPYHKVLMAVSQQNASKRIKLAHSNQPLELAPDAIILNGPPDATCKSARHGHGFTEIGNDLTNVARECLQATQALVHAVNTTDVHNTDPVSLVDATGSAATTTGPTSTTTTTTLPSQEDIASLYQKSFQGLCKSLYLLTQWKESWDMAIAAAVAQEANHHHDEQLHLEQLNDDQTNYRMHTTHLDHHLTDDMMQLTDATPATNIPPLPPTQHHLHDPNQHHPTSMMAMGSSINSVTTSHPHDHNGRPALQHPHTTLTNVTGLAEAVASAAAVAAAAGDVHGMDTTTATTIPGVNNNHAMMGSGTILSGEGDDHPGGGVIEL